MADPIDPDDARFVIDFMERHTGVDFGDMIGLQDKERIVDAARYAYNEKEDLK